MAPNGHRRPTPYWRTSTQEALYVALQRWPRRAARPACTQRHDLSLNELVEPPTSRPAEAGPMLVLTQLLLAAQEAKSGEAESKKREGRGFGHCLGT